MQITRIAAAMLFMVTILGAEGWASFSVTTFARSHKQGVEPFLYVDNDYRNALRAADDVLSAWYRRDWPTDRELLTPELKRKYSSGQIGHCFLGVSTPQNWAFEVVGKERIGVDRIRFQVWTHWYTTADQSRVPHEPPFNLDIVRVGADQWLADSLPCRQID